MTARDPMAATRISLSSFAFSVLMALFCQGWRLTPTYSSVEYCMLSNPTHVCVCVCVCVWLPLLFCHSKNFREQI